MAFSKKNRGAAPNGGAQSTSYKVKEQSILLDFILSMRGEQSRSKVKRLLSQRQVLVNGKLATQFNQELKANDVVEVCSFRVPEKKALIGVKVVHEDEAIMVIEKPANVSCTITKDKQKSVFYSISNYIKSADPKAKAFFVNPLEQECSGLVVVAKSEMLYKRMKGSITKGNFSQKYVAVVKGIIEEDKGSDSRWMQKGKEFTMIEANEASGQAQFGVLNFKVLNRTRELTYVELEKEGKLKQQIRAQLALMGHPIIGDAKYKSGINPIRRFAWHAKTLSFIHPATNKPVNFTSPVPGDIKKLGRK